MVFVDDMCLWFCIEALNIKVNLFAAYLNHHLIFMERIYDFANLYLLCKELYP